MIQDWEWIFTDEQIELITPLITQWHPFPQVLWSISKTRAGIHVDAIEISEEIYQLVAEGYRIQYRRLIWERQFIVELLEKFDDVVNPIQGENIDE